MTGQSKIQNRKSKIGMRADKVIRSQRSEVRGQKSEISNQQELGRKLMIKKIIGFLEEDLR